MRIVLVLLIALAAVGCRQQTAEVPSGPVVFANQKTPAAAIAADPPDSGSAVDAQAENSAAVPTPRQAATVTPSVDPAIEEATSVIPQAPVDLSQVGPTTPLDCVDFSDMRFEVSQRSREIAEIADEFPPFVWLCADTSLTNTALTCFPDLTGQLLDVLEPALGPEPVAEIRSSNAVICRAGNAVQLQR